MPGFQYWAASTENVKFHLRSAFSSCLLLLPEIDVHIDVRAGWRDWRHKTRPVDTLREYSSLLVIASFDDDITCRIARNSRCTSYALRKSFHVGHRGCEDTAKNRVQSRFESLLCGLLASRTRERNHSFFSWRSSISATPYSEEVSRRPKLERAL
jgi:hypothetical protein